MFFAVFTAVSAFQLIDFDRGGGMVLEFPITCKSYEKGVRYQSNGVQNLVGKLLDSSSLIYQNPSFASRT